MRALIIGALGLALVGCGGDGGSSSPDAGPRFDAAPMIDASVVEARPYDIFEPPDYDGSTPTPLLLALHGSAQPGLGQGLGSQYRLFSTEDDDSPRGWLVATPDGIENNSDDVCCRWNNVPDPSEADDLAYLIAVLDDIEANYNVDPDQIHILGFSSGGFMAQILACAIDDRIASVVSIAAAMWTDNTFCTTDSPVSMLHIHGDADTTVPFIGGTTTSSMKVGRSPSRSQSSTHSSLRRS